MSGKIVVAIAISAVGLILLAGLYTLWVGGNVSRTWSNRLITALASYYVGYGLVLLVGVA